MTIRLEEAENIYREAKALYEAVAREESAALTASGQPTGRAAAMAQRSGRAAPSPEQQRTGPPIALVAAAHAAGIVPGTTLSDSASLARVMCDVLQGASRNDAPSGPRIVATSRWSDRYDDSRRLSQNDAFGNGRKIENVCGPEALVASGGVCLPVNVDYAVPTWATPDRLLRDGLAAFQADRGGLRFVSPPDIGVPSLQATASGLGSATGIWTQATDASPAGQTKPVYSVACGSEQLVYVNAIPTRVGFGNMQGRFAPEQIAANTDVAISVAAREAELELLTLMYNASKQVQPTQSLGAVRDTLASVSLLCEQYRCSHRIPRSVGFVMVAPDWAKGVFRSDLARELAHSNNADIDVLAITDEQIENWLKVRGVKKVIWTLDGVKAGTYGTGGHALTNQLFGIMASNAPQPQWPAQSGDAAFMMCYLLYPEGSYQFLDGGRLDLGVIRDSTLDATNDYETFVETFEGIAFRGLEAYQVQQMVIPNGVSMAASAATYHE